MKENLFLKTSEPVRTSIDQSGAIWNLLMLQFNEELAGSKSEVHLGLAIQALGLNIFLDGKFMSKLMAMWRSNCSAACNAPKPVEQFIGDAHAMISAHNSQQLARSYWN